VLLLVFADRHDVRVEDQNIRRHQHGIGEEAVIGREAMRQLVLVGVAALEQTHRRYRAQEPGEFGDFRHVGLFPEHGLLRIKTASQEIQRNIERVFAALGGIGQRGHRMVVGDEVERIALILQFDGGSHHPEIVAEMQRATGLDA
jgi:hypothetical protein